MKFLVTGSTGLVGTQVVKDLTEKNYEVYSCYNNQTPQHGNPIHLDLTDLSSIVTTVEQVKPDVIIHLAAMTDVDGCESDKDLAFLINAQATEKLAKQAALQNAFFVYVSTDYVFDYDSMNRLRDFFLLDLLLHIFQQDLLNLLQEISLLPTKSPWLRMYSFFIN